MVFSAQSTTKGYIRADNKNNNNNSQYNNRTATCTKEEEEEKKKATNQSRIELVRLFEVENIRLAPNWNVSMVVALLT